jgi:hypothetical protein
MLPLSDLLTMLAQVFFVPASFPILWDPQGKVSPWMAGSFTIGYGLLSLGFGLGHLWFSMTASLIGLAAWSLIWWRRT